MNKNLHRVIFNAARGLRVVVQETARGVGKTGRDGTSARGAASAFIAVIASLTAVAAAAQMGSKSRSRNTRCRATQWNPSSLRNRGGSTLSTGRKWNDSHRFFRTKRNVAARQFKQQLYDFATDSNYANLQCKHPNPSRIKATNTNQIIK